MAYRLVLLGSDEIALAAFGALRVLPGVEVVAVYSQPNRPSGRGQEVKSNAVAAWAREQGLLLLQPEKLEATHVRELQALRADLAVVMAYGQILKDDFLAATRLGFVNFHGSLLPALRGATPVESALALNLPVTGVSLQQVVRKLDAGPLHASMTLSIAPGEGRAALRSRLGQLAGTMVPQVIPSVLAGQSIPMAQDEAKVTFSRRLSRADAALDFSQPAAELEGRVRALEGWPGSTFEWRGTVIKVGGARAEASSGSAAPGTILSADRLGVCVACAPGALRMTHLQRPGGNMLPAFEFLAGYPLTVGEVIPSVEMLALVSAQPFPRPSKM